MKKGTTKTSAKQVKETKKKVTKKVEPKVETKKKVNKKKSSTKVFCLFVVVVAFTFAFVLLINAQKRENGYENGSESGFNIKPEEGKVIVAKNLDAVYSMYYVVYVNDDEFSIYVFNYYQTVDQYNMDYNREMENDRIVDYNPKDKMIRYLHSKGYGTYDEVLKNLSALVECDNLLIY